jgi:aspartyl-tRNA(Asn)/glutamyl-tRNA(Gln) amidotransferase subunit A
MTAVEYLLCQERRRAYASRFEELAKTVDVLAAPTLPITAPRIDAGEFLPGRRRETVRNALLRLTRPANLTGAPAISLPCGFSPEGLPIGLQLIGPRLGEAVVLRAAYAYERATPWHSRFPPDPSEFED